MITRGVFGVGDESTRRVETVVGRECGGVAGQEGGVRWMRGAIAAGGAGDPDEVTAGVSD